MMLKDLPDALERQIDYPVDPVTVSARIGDREIEAPDRADSRTIAELLAQVDGDTYESPGQLFDAIVSLLPDAYIGRKFYDDRGSNPLELVPDQRDDVDDRSF